jgi:hypothetical protein
MKKLSFLIVLLTILSVRLNAQTIKISSLKELNHYAQLSNHRIVLKGGDYDLASYLNADSIEAKIARKDYNYKRCKINC